MGEVPASLGAITLFVEDLQRARSFYENVFDLPVAFEDDSSAAFEFKNTIVNLLDIRSADELIRPAAVAGGGTGSRFQLTIWVDDADAACAALEAKGVALLNGPLNREWGVRTATFTDPDGHVWELAQNLGGA